MLCMCLCNGDTGLAARVQRLPGSAWSRHSPSFQVDPTVCAPWCRGGARRHCRGCAPLWKPGTSLQYVVVIRACPRSMSPRGSDLSGPEGLL